MKKLVIPLILLSFFTLLISPISAHEGHEILAQRNTDDNYTTETSTGNKYWMGREVTFTKNVDGDLYALGGKMIVKGDVEDNAMILGGEVEIDGDINGDLSVLGGYIVVNGNINGDVRIFGGQVYINSENIKGDLLVNGGEVKISENTDVDGEDQIGGNNIDTNAEKEEVPTDLKESNTFGNGRDFAAGMTIVSVILGFISIIASIVMGYFVLRFFPVYSEKILRTMRAKFAMSAGVGCLTFVIAPILAFFLLLSFIGYKLLILLVILAILAFFLSEVYTKYLIGRFILEKFGKRNTGRIMPLIAGVLIVDIGLLIISILPIIGVLITSIISLVLSLWGVGAIVLAKFNKENYDD